MFDALFPSHWSDIQKLMWLKILNGGLATYETVVGNPVTFSAKAAPLRQLKVAFSPVQSLNGYDSPWPAGGGVNKLPPAESLTPVTSGELTVTPYADGHYHIKKTASSAALGVSIDFSESVNITTDTYFTPLCSTVSDKVFIGLRGASAPTADIVSTNLGASSKKSVTERQSNFIRISATADAVIEADLYPMVTSSAVTAWSPYENVCPISGWSSLTVEQRGKNLLALPVAYFTVDATVANCFFIKAGTYTFSYSCDQTHRCGYRLLDLNGNVLSDSAHQPLLYFPYNSSAKAFYAGTNRTAGNQVDTLTIVEDCYIRIVSNINATGGGFTSAQLELGSTATEYVPYNPSSRSISINLGSTVYSGTVDVCTGVGEVTHGHRDMGVIGWTRVTGTTNPYFRYELGDRKVGSKIICEVFPAIRFDSLSEFGNTAPDNTAGYSSANKYIAVRDDAYTTESAFKEAFAGKKIVYELATPIPIQLTPQEVQSLLGVNNMWSDANGNLTVEYRSN